MPTAVAPLAHSIAVSSRFATGVAGVGAGGLAFTVGLPWLAVGVGRDRLAGGLGAEVAGGVVVVGVWAGALGQLELVAQPGQPGGGGLGAVGGQAGGAAVEQPFG